VSSLCFRGPMSPSTSPPHFAPPAFKLDISEEGQTKDDGRKPPGRGPISWPRRGLFQEPAEDLREVELGTRDASGKSYPGPTLQGGTLREIRPDTSHRPRPEIKITLRKSSNPHEVECSMREGVAKARPGGGGDTSVSVHGPNGGGGAVSGRRRSRVMREAARYLWGRWSSAP
jgi:hypothetical protein